MACIADKLKLVSQHGYRLSDVWGLTCAEVAGLLDLAEGQDEIGSGGGGDLGYGTSPYGVQGLPDVVQATGSPQLAPVPTDATMSPIGPSNYVNIGGISEPMTYSGHVGGGTTPPIVPRPAPR